MKIKNPFPNQGASHSNQNVAEGKCIKPHVPGRRPGEAAGVRHPNPDLVKPGQGYNPGCVKPIVGGDTWVPPPNVKPMPLPKVTLPIAGGGSGLTGVVLNPMPVGKKFEE